MRGGLAIAALAALVVLARGSASAQPEQLSIGMFAPTAPFDDSDAARDHLEKLAAAIERETGSETSVRVYFRWSDVERARPDFAIVDAPCVVAHGSMRVLAIVRTGDGTHRAWGLYGGAKGDVASLRGQRIALVETGCRDDDVVDHAFFGGDLPEGFFGPRIGKPTPDGALESVTDGVAAAALLPAAAAGELELVYDTGPLPNPAFVQRNRALPERVARAVRRAIAGVRGDGPIRSWSVASRSDYATLERRMRARPKPFVLAPPILFRLPLEGVVDPPEPELPLPDLRHHLSGAGTPTEP